MEITEKIINDFRNTYSNHIDFKAKLEILIRDLLKSNGVKEHQITCRVNDIDKLEEKVKRKKEKYSKLSDITDLIGLRIITYYEDDVDLIADILKKEFIIDDINSIDKRVLENDKFGYRSLHYVVNLNKTRSGLTEYKKYKSLKAEIQIRSILQHAWAEIRT